MTRLGVSNNRHYCLPVMEAWSLISALCGLCLLWRGHGSILVPWFSPSFWWLSGHLWHSLASRSISWYLYSHGVYLVCIYPNFSLLWKHQSIVLGAHPTLVWPHLNYLHVKWLCFPRSPSEVLGVGISTYAFWGDTIKLQILWDSELRESY